MSLVTVVNGQLTDASQLNDVVVALQQPSGGSETGFWFVAGSSALTNGTVSLWVVMTNHLGTPSGVTINTSLQTPTGGANTPLANNLQSNGFQIYIAASSGSSNARTGGGYTTNF